MLKERAEVRPMAGDPMNPASVPSGVLVGVSPVSVPAAEKGATEHFGLLHVLVVDDDEAVRKACCQIASGMGFAVVLGAESATAARAILKHQRIDVLLLDLKLPGGGGLPLLEQVKALHPDTAVIVMTAFATVSSAVEAMRIGAGDYLTKPFALEELTTVLERTAQQLGCCGSG
jgi:DNA-binding NtrC family response regulator